MISDVRRVFELGEEERMGAAMGELAVATSPKTVSRQQIGAGMHQDKVGRTFTARADTEDLSERDEDDPDSYLDEGFLAWSQVLVGHLVAFNSWGYVNSFGVFQAYYTSNFHQSPWAVSWVGSIQIFLTLFVGSFSGRAMDAGLYRYAATAGSVLQIIGVFSTSAVTQYWHLLLAQGICQGLGNGLVFTPTMAMVSTYFTKRRSLAIAGMSSGTATGGVVFPLVARQLLHRLGFGWTVRVMGFIILTNASVVLLLARPRPLPPRKQGPVIELQSFQDPWFSLSSLGLLSALLGLYFGYYYVTPFALDIIHAPPESSVDLLLVANGLGLPGRVFRAWLADRYFGPLNTLILTVALSGILTYAWAGVTTIRGTWAFAIMYGFFGAGIQSMFPPALANSGRDPSKMGMEMGMVFSVMSVGCLCGPPIAGVLIERADGDYLYAQMFAGSALTFGAVVLLAPRIISVGWSMVKKV